MYALLTGKGDRASALFQELHITVEASTTLAHVLSGSMSFRGRGGGGGRGGYGGGLRGVGGRGSGRMGSSSSSVPALIHRTESLPESKGSHLLFLLRTAATNRAHSVRGQPGQARDGVYAGEAV